MRKRYRMLLRLLVVGVLLMVGAASAEAKPPVLSGQEAHRRILREEPGAGIHRCKREASTRIRCTVELHMVLEEQVGEGPWVVVSRYPTFWSAQVCRHGIEWREVPRP